MTQEKTLIESISSSFASPAQLEIALDWSFISFLKLGKLPTVINQLDFIHSTLSEKENSTAIDFVSNIKKIKDITYSFFVDTFVNNNILITLPPEYRSFQYNRINANCVTLNCKLTQVCDFFKVVDFCINRLAFQYNFNKNDFTVCKTFFNLLTHQNKRTSRSNILDSTRIDNDIFKNQYNLNLALVGKVVLDPTLLCPINDDIDKYIQDNAFMYTMFIGTLEKTTNDKFRHILASICSLMSIESLYHCICNAWFTSSLLLNTTFNNKLPAKDNESTDDIQPFLKYAVQCAQFVALNYFDLKSSPRLYVQPEHYIFMSEFHRTLMSVNKP